MKKTTRLLISGLSALAIIASAAPVVTIPALAQNGQGQGKGGANAEAGQGNQGQGNQGQGAQGSRGQGGPNTSAGGEEDSDRRGPQYGQPAADEQRGGKPAWGGEDYPEVELGRLSVIKSPDKVLDQAFNEVVSNFDAAASADYYEMSASAFANEAATNWDSMTIVDFPLQNLALLRELWTTGNTSLPGVDLSSTDITELSAILIGVASDKELPVTEDTVRALAIIIGVNLPDSGIAAIAQRAEDVRESVAVGHG